MSNIKKIISVALIILHLFSFGPIRDVFAFSAWSASYRMTPGILNEGGRDRISLTTKIWQDAIGESFAGRLTSINYILNSGFIPIIQSQSPVLIQKIPYQNWPMNTSKDNAFDLDDYFLSPEGYPLTYTVSGNSKINVKIDPNTHMVSFSQAKDWS